MIPCRLVLNIPAQSGERLPGRNYAIVPICPRHTFWRPQRTHPLAGAVLTRILQAQAVDNCLPVGPRFDGECPGRINPAEPPGPLRMNRSRSGVIGILRFAMSWLSSRHGNDFSAALTIARRCDGRAWNVNHTKFLNPISTLQPKPNRELPLSCVQIEIDHRRRRQTRELPHTRRNWDRMTDQEIVLRALTELQLIRGGLYRTRPRDAEITMQMCCRSSTAEMLWQAVNPLSKGYGLRCKIA